MHFNGLSINVMTLGGLALGVGMLVDNSIVVIENVYRHLQLGSSGTEAARNGTAEVAGAITSSTLTTVAVFLPVVFLGGLTAELFKELALTVTFALLASWIVALTVIPMLASLLLKAAAGGKHARSEGFYGKLLKAALRHPVLTLFLALVVLGSAVYWLIPQIGTEFLPTPDEGTFVLSMQLPAGTGLRETENKVRELERVIMQIPEVQNVTSRVGLGQTLDSLRSSATGGPHVAEILVTLVPALQREASTEEVMVTIRDKVDKVKGGAEVSYNLQSALAAAAGRPKTIEMTLTGPDLEGLRSQVLRVVNEVAQVDGIAGVESNIEKTVKEIHLRVDGQKALKYGMNPAQVSLAVSRAVRGTVVGRIDSAAGYDGRVFEGGRDIRVIYRRDQREPVDALEELLIYTPAGAWIRLGEVASFEESTGPLTLTREDGRASAQIIGRLQGSDLGTVGNKIKDRLQALELPDGYDLQLVGASKLMTEGFEDLRFALLLSIALVYMIMAAQFESLVAPISILFSLPFAGIGVLLVLYLTGFALGITAYMGIIMLAGIVVNNAIVIVSFIQQLREQGLQTTPAVVEAAKTRLRPIMMTALTTVLGLLPLALARGEGAELQKPLAWVVIGGLSTSTLITLIIVPVVFSLLDRITNRVGGEQDLAQLAGAVSMQQGTIDGGSGTVPSGLVGIADRPAELSPDWIPPSKGQQAPLHFTQEPGFLADSPAEEESETVEKSPFGPKDLETLLLLLRRLYRYISTD
jgi:HAE1 family hydrophobic/amphiphilic exporter-1